MRKVVTKNSTTSKNTNTKTVWRRVPWFNRFLGLGGGVIRMRQPIINKCLKEVYLQRQARSVVKGESLFESARNTLHQGDNSSLLLISLTIFSALMLVIIMIMIGMLAGTRKRITTLTRGGSGQNLEDVIHSQMDQLDDTKERMELIEQAVGVLQAQMPGCLQKLKMIRYDAFDDVGGEQSFSLALLDQLGEGIVLTSVYSRMDVRVYAKSIHNGKASHPLSKEEERILRETANK